MGWIRSEGIQKAGLAFVLVMAAVVSPAVVFGQFPSSAPENIPDPLIFAGSHNYPPFQWLDENGKPRGLLIDLQDALARQQGLEARHRLTEWDQALAAVESGGADVVALFVSEERKERFRFTSPVYYVPHGIYSSSAESVKVDPDDLSGMRVAVVQGGYAQNRLNEESSGGKLTPEDSIRSALLAVVDGRADIALVAAHTARHVISEIDLDIHQVSPPFWPRAYALAVRKDREDLHAWLDEQVNLLQANGTYFEIHSNWLSRLEWQPPTWKDHLRTLAWIVLPLLLLGGIGYLWSWALRGQVANKTRQLVGELETRRSLQQELQYQLDHDDLTGLPNRNAFVRRLDGLIATYPDWSPTVALVQLVNLEQLIAAFSHSVSLELQKAFGSLLEAENAELVGHFGSGLFAIATSGPLKGNDFIERLNEPLDLGSVDLDPMFIAGIVNEAGLEEGEGADEVVRRGVLAVSVAGDVHRRWMLYSLDLEPDADDLLLLRDFRRHGVGEMFLEYQPKLDVETGRVRDAEALIRWRHSTLGVVPPGRFIPMLEQAGLTHWITRWVIEEVGDMLQRTGLSASGFRVSINLSPQDLMEPDLVDFIRSRLGSPVSGQGLWLEITETGLIYDPLRTRDVLSELHDAGVCFSVDDFGTGYASLSYMSEFPVNDVKIDKSFVGDMLANERHLIIVRSTIALAHELGMTVTAEGVEDRETLQALVAMNCDTVQGFYFSRPLGEKHLLTFLDTGMEGTLSEETGSQK